MILLCVIFTLSVSAKDISGPAGTITVNGEERTYIRNEFYSLYHDKLFEEVYEIYANGKENGIKVYKQLDGSTATIETVTFESLGKIDGELLKKIKSSQDTYYLSAYLKYDSNFNKAENIKLLSGIKAEVIYIGSTTPCAIFAVESKNIDSILENKNIEYLNYAFLAFSTNFTSVIPENGDRTYSPNASDARKILRYAAKLYNPTDKSNMKEIKEFFIMSDANFDGKLTAADARMALRMSAKLEKPNKFTHYTDSFWTNI